MISNNEFTYFNDYFIEIYTRGERKDNTFCLLGEILPLALDLKKRDPRYVYSVNCLICWMLTNGKISKEEFEKTNINYSDYDY